MYMRFGCQKAPTECANRVSEENLKVMEDDSDYT